MRLSSAGSGDYTGGLDRSGTTDGKHFVFWEDRVTQVRVRKFVIRKYSSFFLGGLPCHNLDAQPGE